MSNRGRPRKNIDNVIDEFDFKVPVIYVITNKVNNKRYVGFTKCFGDRINDSKRGKLFNVTNKLREDYAKYGREAFDTQMFYREGYTIEQLKEEAAELIKEYDCIKPKGYNCSLPNKVLTEDLVRQVKTRMYNSNLTNIELAREFGLTSSVIWSIKEGKIWDWVTVEKDEKEEFIKKCLEIMAINDRTIKY